MGTDVPYNISERSTADAACLYGKETPLRKHHILSNTVGSAHVADGRRGILQQVPSHGLDRQPL